MKKNKWIEWELSYSLKLIPTQYVTSHRNGIVAVISKVNGGYDWFRYYVTKSDGCKLLEYRTGLVHDIVNANRFNQEPKVYSCPRCQSVDALNGSYIAFVTEEDFLANPNKYIDNAYDKSQNDAAGYTIKPTA